MSGNERGRYADNPWQNEDELRRLYWSEGMSCAEIGEHFGTCASTIYNWMEKFDIERRSQTEAQQKVLDADKVRRLYKTEGLTQKEVAERLDTSRSCVMKNMKRHGIESRRGRDSQQTNGEWHDCVSCGSEHYRPKSKLTHEKYFCSQACRNDWMSDSFTGEDNPAWKGGWDEYYGPNWENQRQKALERDGYECRACGMSQEQHRGEYGTGLNVHHVVPHREFEDVTAANDLGNLVTACKRCHNRFEGLPVFPI